MPKTPGQPTYRGLIVARQLYRPGEIAEDFGCYSEESFFLVSHITANSVVLFPMKHLQKQP